MIEVPKALPTKMGKPMVGFQGFKQIMSSIGDPGSEILGLTCDKSEKSSEMVCHIRLQNQGSCNILGRIDCVLLQKILQQGMLLEPNKIN